MPRRPRPWFRHDPQRPDKNDWWVTVGGERHRLHRGGKSAADRTIAETRFHELMLACDLSERGYAKLACRGKFAV